MNNPIDRYEAWAARREIDSPTLRVYRRHLEALARHAAARGRRRLHTLRDEDLHAFVKEGRDDPIGTQQPRFAAIRDFYKFLLETGSRADNPAADLRLNRSRRKPVRTRPGRVGQKMAKLSAQDQRVVEFWREVAPGMRATEAFSIKEELPVGHEVVIRAGKRRGQRIVLSEKARQILDGMGGTLPYGLRTFQRRCATADLIPKELKEPSRSAITVELHSATEAVIHPYVGRGQLEDATEKTFDEIEVRLSAAVGSEAGGLQLVQEALGQEGVLASVIKEPGEREALRMLVSGSFSFFHSQTARGHLSRQDPMYVREALLIGDFLLRIIDGLTSELRLQRLIETTRAGAPVRTTENQLRKLGPIEFQRWVVERFSGIQASRSSGDQGIDGLEYPNGFPIQAKQQDRVGRNVVDNFETAVERAGQRKGFLVAFSFTKNAGEEAERARAAGKVDVQLITVAELIRNVPS